MVVGSRNIFIKPFLEKEKEYFVIKKKICRNFCKTNFENLVEEKVDEFDEEMLM